MKTLTAKQANILSRIIEFKEVDGYPPTFRELAGEFKITTKGMHDHLKAIEKKGFLETAKNKSRGLKILKYPDGRKYVVAESRSVPLYKGDLK